MSIGLEKILERIGVDPSNKTLIKRYVALVKELPTEDGKVKYTLNLARILAAKDPASAMEFAYQVFQYQDQSVEALVIVSSCLKRLGKLSKSAIIDIEIDKLQNPKGPDKVPNFDANGLPQKGVFGEAISTKASAENFQPPPKISVPPPPSSQGLNISKLPAIENKAARPRDFVVFKGQDELSEAGRQLSSEKTKVENDNSARTFGLSTSFPETVVGEIDFPSQISYQGPDKEIVIEMFDFHWRQGELEQAINVLSKVPSQTQSEPWWRARTQLVDERLKAGGEPAKNPSERKLKDSEASSAKLSEWQKWGDELDRLIAMQRYRKALNLITKKIDSDISLNWAEEAYKRLPDIWNALHLFGFEWNPDEGSSILKKKLSVRPTMKYSLALGQFA